MSDVAAKAAQVRKSIVGAVGLVATLAASGLVHGTAEAVLTSVLAVATVFGIYKTPNA